MFNPDIQYRCDIIRGKAQKELDDLLPTYAAIVADICPADEIAFNQKFNDKLSQSFHQQNYNELDKNQQKTIRNHITEIAGKLFGLYFKKNGLVYESPSNHKLVTDYDQPAFFKNLCLNFQFPNGTQKIQTIVERINQQIKFKPFHFILALLAEAEQTKFTINTYHIGYYVLNALEVLQGKVTPKEVLDTIIFHSQNNSLKRVPVTSHDFQHIRELLNLLVLANLIVIDENRNSKAIQLNHHENELIQLFIKEYNTPLQFNIYQFDLNAEHIGKQIETAWTEYFAQIALQNAQVLNTVLPYQHQTAKKIDKNELGKMGEEWVFQLEQERVKKYNPRLINQVQLVGEIRGLGYDVKSVAADENPNNPDFDKFIEVKSTIRVTAPDLDNHDWIDTVNLTRKEWVAAEQFQAAYMIYRVYFTAQKIYIRKIINPFEKNKQGIIYVMPTMYRMDFGASGVDVSVEVDNVL
ncbi:protein NO VEIN domain-containing protein [Kingella kingae]|uniref:protein NO VEIN domain-containing protein n=1 Tax=Kingella kingae TaxID=504 RepID=UPI002554F191|nr:DUF3883 domain-containing protein [Kingella kingae]MDK4624337.1 DUF3883 domain-containing protein [Kingella kingae]MDK4659930.1 DUF3883 domain-containing protein [Kingella kingae]MDK4667857.1 DUF3883 domain-containing protein [Kingella kingae]MDK4686219.1 DUF3883 domain-containing protein [Kingella kingae]